MGNRKLTDDVLSTTVCLVDQIQNSRPLTSVSDDPEGLQAFTVKQFLLRLATPSAPFVPNAQRYTDLRRVFRISQAFADMIWGNGTKNTYPNEMRDLNGIDLSPDNLKSTT